MWNVRYKNEFARCVTDLEEHPDVCAMRAFPQHALGVSTYDHCVLVAYSSFRLCKALGLDARSAARGGMLHDFFLYNWQERKGKTLLDHVEHHPWYALRNAEARFVLNDTERDVIASHMWPVTPTKFYHKWESLVVSCMDKVCAAAELLHLAPYLLQGREGKEAEGLRGDKCFSFWIKQGEETALAESSCVGAEQIQEGKRASA